jgi:urea transporter
MYSYKRLFVGLCVTVWFINTCMAGAATLSGIWLGLGISLISIPVWALIGSAFSSSGIFLLRWAKVDINGLSLWQKADVGLALAVVFKPALGIAF